MSFNEYKILIMKNIVSLSIYLISIIGYSQTFQVEFGSDDIEVGNTVHQCNDGGYVISGSTRSYGNGSHDLWLLKLNSEGVLVWDRTFGGSNIDYSNYVIETQDLGFVIVGYTHSYGNGQHDTYIIKTDPFGIAEWERVAGGSEDDVITEIQEVEGGYILVGYTYSYGNGLSDVYLEKIDNEGNEIWLSTFGGANFDVCNSVQQHDDGSYILLGSTKSFGSGDYDIYLLKTDSLGNELWSKTYGSLGLDKGMSIRLTQDGGYIVLAETESFGQTREVQLLKLFSNGDVEWNKLFGGANYDYGRFTNQTSDGGYIIVGNTLSFGVGGTDVWLIETIYCLTSFWWNYFKNVL